MPEQVFVFFAARCLRRLVYSYNLICHVDSVRITGKFPGYLSPSAGLKFADVPNLDHVARLLEFQFRCTGACLLRAVQGKPRFVLLY